MKLVSLTEVELEDLKLRWFSVGLVAGVILSCAILLYVALSIAG